MKKLFCLLTFLFLFSSLYGEPLTADPPPQQYSRDLTVSLGLTDYAADIYYFFEESNDRSPVPSTAPIKLSALEGEERSYTIHAFAVPKGKEISEETITDEEVFPYTIDKRPPGSPSASIPAGVYYDDLTVTFQYRTGQPVYFSLVGDEQPIEITKQWSGEPLFLEGRKGAVSRYMLEVFTYDDAGNKSRTNTYHYLIDKQGEEKIRQLEVISPIEGDFANLQLLYIKHSGYSWVRYSLDGSNPVPEGTLYKGPFIIPETGAVTARIAAYDENAKKIIEKRINFHVDSNPKEILSLESGVYTEEKTVTKKGTEQYRLSLNDSRPEEWAETIVNESIRLSITKNAQKPVFIRLLNDSHPDDSEYRSVYVMDGRIPAQPEIHFFERTRGGSEGVEVAILGPTYGTIHYTLDGRYPDRLSPKYSGPFFISYEDSSDGPVRRIRAITLDANGSRSEVSEQEIRIPEKKRVPPPEIEEGPEGTYTLKHPGDVSFVYEIGTNRQNLAEPTLNSPRISAAFTCSYPYGFSEVLFLHAAAVDSDDNISRPSRILQIEIDNNPPSKPVFRYENSKLFIESEANADIRYVISQNGEEHPDVNRKGIKYTGPIPIRSEEGLKKTYTLSAFALDRRGNKSPTAGPEAFSIDLRSTSIPVMSGVEDGGSYKDPVVLRFTLEKADEMILYTYSLDGSVPADPDFSSKRADDRTIVFEGRENSVMQVRLKYAAALSGPKRIGGVHETAFVIDRNPPAVPEPAGFAHGRIYTGPVSITIPEQEDGVEYYFGLVRGNGTPPDCFGTYGQLLEGPVEFDLPEGEEERFAFMFGAKDRAGNKVYNNTIYTFTIDKQGPPNPKPIGIPEKPVNGPVEVGFDFTEGEIYYEFAEGGNIPEEPSEASFLYSSPILFKGKPDREVVYTIKIKARDIAFNFSPHSAVYSFVIDKKPPSTVDKPLVREVGDKIYISWPHPQEDNIFFSLRRDNKTIFDWKEFADEFLLEQDQLRRAVVLQVYRKDAAGNKSPTSSYEIWRELLETEQIQLLSGIENGKTYNSSVIIEPYDGSHVIKYEIAFQGLEPPDVTVFSDELDLPVSLDVLTGETKNFSVKARLYDKLTKNFVSEEQTVDFSIDKTPPPPPEIEVKSGSSDYFQSDVKIGIGALEGDIFYKIRELDAFNTVLEEGEYTHYQDEIVLYAEEGMFKTYDIISYSVDSAGNKSKTAKRSGIVIDKQIIYVSDAGNDDYPGSRSRPFESIEKAVKTAGEKGREIIMVASGKYELEKTISLHKNLTILGGYHAETWERNEGGPTIITEGQYFPPRAAFFECSADKIQLSNMEFETGEKEIVPVRVISGSARIEKILFYRETRAGLPALLQTGGELTVVNSSFLSKTNGSGALVEVRGAKSSSFSGSIFEGAKDERGSSTLLRLTDAQEVTIADSTFQPGTGRVTEALFAENSKVKVTGCLLYSGSGSVRSAAIHLEESSLTGNEIIIQTDSSSRITSGVLAYDSELTLRGSTMQFGGEGGSVGVYTEAGVLRIESSIIKGNPKSEFLHLFQAKESEIYLFNNMISSSMNGDFVGFDFDRGSADIFNNTIVLEFGPGDSYFIRSDEKTDLSVYNNILIQNNQEQRGTVFYSPRGQDSCELIANSIHGWKRIILWDGGEVSEIDGLNELDENPFGGRFHKNIAESLYETFLVTKGEQAYRLKQSSKCVNGGINVSDFGGPDEDYEGDARPNPDEGLKPAYDIGADEF
jgi:hypothetical protein